MIDTGLGRVAKVRVKAEIVTIDGVARTGHIFVHPNERIIDMMNDARAFIAFEADGGFEVVSKHVIVTVRHLRQFGAKRESEPDRAAMRSANADAHADSAFGNGANVETI